MRKLVLALVLFASASAALAQTDMRPMADEKSFIASVQAQMEKVSSIQSDFKQRKHLSAMTKEIESHGKFYYEKSDKVCMDFQKPSPSKIVINGDKLLLEMGGVKNVCSISSSATMQEMVKVMSACMTGNLQEMKADYQLEFLENETNYMVKVFPKKSSAKKMVDHIELLLLKSDFSVEAMKMVETSRRNSKGQDFTEYIFMNKKVNVAIPASTFSLK